MSTRELAYSIFDRLTDEQLEGFVLMFKDTVPETDVSDDEILEALAEVEEMERHPENYKGYTDIDEMMRELLA